MLAAEPGTARSCRTAHPTPACPAPTLRRGRAHPEREYLLVTEFFADAVELGEAEVTDQVIDDGLQIIRKLWEAGLAHRDIKPPNLTCPDPTRTQRTRYWQSSPRQRGDTISETTVSATASAILRRRLGLGGDNFAGGRDRFRTCGLCRVKTSPPASTPQAWPASTSQRRR
jgi:hypothetical protein